MYIWLVLSTFLAILAGYSLPMRADTPEKINIPVAAAHTARMVINHRSALDYARKSKWPYYCDGVVEGTTVDDCDKEKSIGFEAGYITFEKIKDYIPQEFTYSNDYSSYILCLDENDEESLCQNQGEQVKQRFLVTFGDLHEKWLSSSSLATSEGSLDKPVVTPNDDMIKAFWQIFGCDESAGYIKEEDDAINIINYQGLKVFNIPQAMWSVMEASGICNERYNGSCLAYVSTL